MSKLRVALTLALLASASLAQAQGTYTQIDYPGSIATSTLAINTAGGVVGYYSLQNSSVTHGFLLSAGTYTTIDYPGASATFLKGLNDVGQIVGYATTPTGNVGFSYDLQTQTFTLISFPGTNPTYPNAINNDGTVVGWVDVSTETFGFTLTGSQYRRVPAPIPEHSWAMGIDSAGEVLGIVDSLSQGQKNFTFYNGAYKRLTIPGLLHGSASSTNPSGTAFVGSYSDAGPGFVYENNTLTTLRFPGGRQTFGEGVNDAGEAVGWFYDYSSFNHGFLWAPPAPAQKN